MMERKTRIDRKQADGLKKRMREVKKGAEWNGKDVVPGSGSDQPGEEAGQAQRPVAPEQN